jgi:NADPH2:quinone reductase
MQAIVIREHGTADVLRQETLPTPTITDPHDVLIQLKAASVNPVDTKIRTRGPMHPNVSLTVPGCDGAGIVTAVGNQVTRIRPGDAVWFCYGGLGGLTGSYAEYIVLPEHVVYAMPKTLNFIEAAATPLVLITAWEALFDRAGLQSGQTVLIHGGAGGVGHIAIQLARIAGARVAATVSDERKADFVRQLGAEWIIDYRTENLHERIADWTQGRGVDIALDTVGPQVLQNTVSAMAIYGNLVTLLDPGTQFNFQEARQRNLRLSLTLMLTPQLRQWHDGLLAQGQILRRGAEWIDNGQLMIHVASTQPYTQAPTAHQRLEAGGMQGKLVLTVDHAVTSS